MLSNNTGATNMPTASPITVAQPNTMVAVFERTSGTANTAAIGNSGGSFYIGTSLANNTGIFVESAGNITRPANDNAFHAEIGVSATGVSNCVLNIDGSEAATNCTNGFSAETPRLFRAPGASSLIGYVMEAGIWPSGFSSGNRTAVCHNMNVAYGSFTGGC
jgi:hypothetical protein